MDDSQLPLTRGLGWVGIVGTRSETLSFYRDGLGLRLDEQDPAYDYLAAGGEAFVEIYEPAAAGAKRIRPDAPAVGFLVDDLDVAAARLRATGADIGDAISEWSTDEEAHRWFYVTDPEGNVVVLIERRSSALRPQLGHVNLAVADLDRAVGFYVDTLGFELTQRSATIAFLATSDYHHELGLTVTSERAEAPSRVVAHAAFRYPSRAAARKAVTNVRASGCEIESAYDHGVGESAYLTDPDGNGLELYYDRPRGEWPRDSEGRLAMRSRALDIQDVFASRSRR